MKAEFPHQYEVFLKKADADYALVKHALSLPTKHIDPDIIFFHLQQAVEKYIKALISFKGFHFEKIHDISKLISICRSNGIELPEAFDIFIELNPYAVEGRYDVVAETPDDAAGYTDLLSHLENFVKTTVSGGYPKR